MWLIANVVAVHLPILFAINQPLWYRLLQCYFLDYLYQLVDTIHKHCPEVFSTSCSVQILPVCQLRITLNESVLFSCLYFWRCPVNTCDLITAWRLICWKQYEYSDKNLQSQRRRFIFERKNLRLLSLFFPTLYTSIHTWRLAGCYFSDKKMQIVTITQ